MPSVKVKGEAAETDRNLVAAWGWGRGQWRVTAQCTPFPFRVMKTPQNQREVMAAQHCECTKGH